LECAQIGSSVRILRRQRFDISDFDIGGFHTGPFGACAKKPAPKAFGDHARGVKCIAWNQLDALAVAQIRADYGTLARAIGSQHQYLNRIADVIMIKLIIADTVQTDALVRPALP
jgi:hypothetical protein